MDELQYRVITARANMREEPDGDSRVRAVLTEGAIVHLDPDRKATEHWKPVKICRGWMHDSVIQVVEPSL